jgi:dienelactone hydrolase
MIRVPMRGTDKGLLTRICRPNSNSPSPLVVINHGSPAKPKVRTTIEPTACGPVSKFFTSRGYVVAFPLRRGYGETGGDWAETFGKCDRPAYVHGGQTTAEDIAAAVNHLSDLPYVAKGRTVIVGQSAGGWGTLAYANQNPSGIAAFINFAGGRGGHRDGQPNDNCSPDALVAAAAALGKQTRQPTLWIYTENDSFFSKDLSRRMHQAYVEAGGKARYELLPGFGEDGHQLFFGSGGVKRWGPLVDNWLKNPAVH